MKGIYFQKPLESILKVDGETWRQGDSVSGTLEIRNHGSEPVAPSQAHVMLTRGELKKVRAKDAAAFQVIQSVKVGNDSMIAPGATASFPWTVSTDRNGPVTDSMASPFLLYGVGESPETLGQLQLTFEPHELLQEFIKSFSVGFRFVLKSRRSSKGGWVEFKLDPPDSKAFSTLELLVLSARFDGEAVDLEYEFQLKKIEATVAGTHVKKLKKQFEQRLEPHQLRVPSGRINYEQMEAGIGEALQQVESKILF